MFEKSLYDLIRGLRNHKGSEREYLQNSLQECRAEIKSADMDLKATALLKLVYLEMFGHDMSWASFHVLEVMSSQKYLQKRVGYLAAVQSFRPDTEVLMLATNLLKKDLNSAQLPTLSLPLVSLPHVNTASLALSLSSDVLPRLTHSSPFVRKRTVVTLYRLALVHPETLRIGWPKLKDLLMNDEEDASVTAAVVNVICELGWRRPQDFLPLAPRLFDLLVEGSNNWMAIKIIKLFATLTPLEPRLVKKLLPPLTTLIRTTPAMSLLYECINGIIQGGIFKSDDSGQEGDEIARLCTAKLRDMILVEDDPNLRYVALLAFNQIVLTHPLLVSAHQDAILSCIDDLDISIRLQALDLATRMVNPDNLVEIVSKLMRQLKDLPTSTPLKDDLSGHHEGIQPAADSEDEDPEETLKPTPEKTKDAMTLPTEHRFSTIRRILQMCSRETYANIVDFEWYIEILSQLAKLIPKPDIPIHTYANIGSADMDGDVASDIGLELRNIAVRVEAVRPEVVAVASMLISTSGGDTGFPNISLGGRLILRHAAWIVGEYASNLADPPSAMNDLINPRVATLHAECISSYLLSIPKVLIIMTTDSHQSWSPERKSMASLLLARIIHFLEPLVSNIDLEVQNRAVELLELFRLMAQATTDYGNDELQGPLLLTTVLPSLYTGDELKPVALEAQSKIPVPEDLDLEEPINPNLADILNSVGYDDDVSGDENNDFAEIDRLYYERPVTKSMRGPFAGPAINLIRPPDSPTDVESYQRTDNETLNPEIITQRKLERRAKNKDDPFYIGGDDSQSGTSTPFHEILHNTNGDDVDVDSIPIMNLNLGDSEDSGLPPKQPTRTKKRKITKQYSIAPEETLNLSSSLPTSSSKSPIIPKTSSLSTSPSAAPPYNPSKRSTKSGFLSVDSSNLTNLTLNGDNDTATRDGALENAHHVYRTEEEEAEMAQALKEVERLRLEMQRAEDRVEVGEGVDPEGTVVRKKKKKRKKVREKDVSDDQQRDGEGHVEVV